jgi:hypothetical protein
MIDTRNVMGFLDVFVARGPSLALVTGRALGVGFCIYCREKKVMPFRRGNACV